MYSPRGAGSSSAMISIVRCFGAPVIEPHGYSAVNSSASVTAPARPKGPLAVRRYRRAA